MTETIDSHQQELDLSQIIMRSVNRSKQENELPPGVTVVAALASIARESGMPDAEVKQIGNTVFLSHFSKDKQETSTRAFNMDTARNFVDNSFEYTNGLANSGVRRMTVDFKGDSIRQMLLAVSRQPIAQRFWGLQIFKTADGGYRAYVNLQRTEQ